MGLVGREYKGKEKSRFERGKRKEREERMRETPRARSQEDTSQSDIEAVKVRYTEVRKVSPETKGRLRETD